VLLLIITNKIIWRGELLLERTGREIADNEIDDLQQMQLLSNKGNNNNKLRKRLKHDKNKLKSL
jgi:hypothetical protein